MLDWMKEKKGRFLTCEDGETFFKEAKEKISSLELIGLTLEYRAKIEAYGIAFSEKPSGLINFLDSHERQVFNLVSPHKTILSSIKVCKTLKGIYKYQKDDSHIFILLSTLLLIKDSVIKTFESRTSNNLLVIECQAAEKNVDELYHQLSEVTRSNDNKKIILITQENDPLAGKFKNNFSGDRYEDKKDERNSLTDLDDESQEKLLNEGKVVFQGEEVSLDTLIDERSKHLINGEVLSKLIDNEKIEIGKQLTGLGMVKDYHVERDDDLERKVKVKKERITENIADLFVVTNISENESSSLFSPPSSWVAIMKSLFYQLKLLMLFSKRGLDKGYSFLLGTDVEAAGKFGDLVFKYPDTNGKTRYSFLQVKYQQDEFKKITIKDLFGRKDSQFCLQRYFTSYRKIKQNPGFEDKTDKNFIIYTNVDLDVNQSEGAQIGFVEVEQSDEILDFKEGARGIRYRLTLDKQSGVYEALKETSELHILAKEFAKCVLENQPINLRADIFKSYHVALAKEVIDIANKKFRDSFINSQGLSLSARNFREVFEKFLKTKKVSWKTIGREQLNLSRTFGKGKEPHSKTDLPNDHVTDEEIESFFESLVLAVNQPNEIELGEILKSMLGDKFYTFQDFVLNWIKEKNGYFLSHYDVAEQIGKGNLNLGDNRSQEGYSKLRSFSSFVSGSLYEFKLLMLFLKRIVDNQYSNFCLAKDVSEAGKFDNLVFKYTATNGKTRYSFLQVKYQQDE
jgi:hypothetical protein